MDLVSSIQMGCGSSRSNREDRIDTVGKGPTWVQGERHFRGVPALSLMLRRKYNPTTTSTPRMIILFPFLILATTIWWLFSRMYIDKAVRNRSAHIHWRCYSMPLRRLALGHRVAAGLSSMVKFTINWVSRLSYKTHSSYCRAVWVLRLLVYLHRFSITRLEAMAVFTISEIAGSPVRLLARIRTVVLPTTVCFLCAGWVHDSIPVMDLVTYYYCLSFGFSVEG